jgi:hypothetical protein
MSAKPESSPATSRDSTRTSANPVQGSGAAAGEAATPAATNSQSARAEHSLPGATSPPAKTQAQADRAPTWRQDDGAPVSCVEKIKVLNENYAELKQTAQDAFEDALLMGCSEAQVRVVLRELIDALDNPYRKIAQNPGQE